MPVSDGCGSEEDALKEALNAADEFLEEYFEAREQLLEMLRQAEEDAIDAVGPEPPEITRDMDPMLQHELERQWEEYRDKVGDHVNSSSDVEAARNHADNLRTAWEITMEEADALREELEVCQHDLNETILTP
ncbi:hypothetical protein PARPLA_02350 [Rhodobacteraceae bacterium THAF1]|uniref:hypothetical protein n=1 Tax=Palleronia sp. THAF1 TaxID=2587842 RepID=UPI000F3DBB4D|nr:hypothetical protein [Palleronia sp. THAF1]QFU08707.1 hypothetical protein FIU81_08480 [Palleronia sp. THAF1]VDC27084.1 hypothetical protein PARPLA_02350 [Rhodobacteraceae bacterium THAF1]